MTSKITKKTAPDGTVSWNTRLDLPPDPDTGIRRQKRLTAPTKKEVEAKIAQLINSIATGSFAEAEASKITVGQYLRERWLPAIEHTIKPASFTRYDAALRKHVEPKIGALLLSKLKPMHIQQLYADRLTAGLSANTVKHLHNILHHALKQAVRWELLVRNPSDAVEVPRAQHVEFITWSTQQAKAFLEAAAGDEWGALLSLALLTGMRRGEILGLRWEDVDLAGGRIFVKRTLIRDAKGALVDGTPKTAAGRRVVAIPASTVESLRRHEIRQKAARLKAGASYNKVGLVFADALGNPLHPSTLRRQFDRLTEVAGVPRIRLHDLRHTNATMMLANGEHPKIVQERLGHSDVSMTLNRYSHVTPDMQRKAADRLDDLLEGAS